MPYRRIHNPRPPSEPDIDAAEAAAEAFLANADDDLSMLTRLAQIGMEAMEAQNDYLKARLAAAASGETPLRPGEDLAAPLDKLSQSVRRTVALKRKLAEDLKKHRQGLAVESGARRTRRADDHRRAVRDSIDDALTEAFTRAYGDGDDETDEGDALCREMLAVTENLLGDLDDTSAWLERPVGETVALLCEALGLPAETCVKENGVWRINCNPTPWQTYVATRTASSLPRSGEGQTAKPSGWGSVDDVHQRC